MKIVKHSGDIVNFEKSKLEKSLLKSGANQNIVENVLKQIDGKLYDGITTKKIYKIAFDLLKKESNVNAARYNLRASLELLGPAGFYFEKYISYLFREEGYTTLVNLNLEGKCVSHEVDLVIQKGNQVKMIECKFHSNRDIVSDVKVPMYILSRFNDLKSKEYVIFDQPTYINNCLIATNNRFSDDAIKFAVCSGLELLSWDFPKGNNLRNKIENTHLYPITCLTTLSLAEKEQLLMLDIIVANQLKEDSESLSFIGLSQNRIKNICKEVSELCI